MAEISKINQEIDGFMVKSQNELPLPRVRPRKLIMSQKSPERIET